MGRKKKSLENADNPTESGEKSAETDQTVTKQQEAASEPEKTETEDGYGESGRKKKSQKIRFPKPGETKYDGVICFSFGFLVPALTALIGYAVLKIWPFGDETVLIVDSIHQYLPFYTDLHEKLVNHEPLMYSFAGGLGYNFWATLAYYMACPLNLLMALIPKANVADFMDWLILLKIGLCGGTFAWYLNKRDPARRFWPVVLGTMFALSNYIIGYYFNLMWLDSIAMLPLIMLGIERIVKGQKGGLLYGLSLFYALWCNYYIGFMLCIFAVLYLIVCMIQIEPVNGKLIVRRGIRFGWFSLLAGGMAAAMLIPAFLALRLTQAPSTDHFPYSLDFYMSLADMLTAHFAGRRPVNVADNQAYLNAYCGVIVMILVLLFVMDNQIKLRKRLSMVGLSGFLLFSFSCNYLNYIWHGFHRQSGLPNRFAFLYIGILLIMAYDVLPHIRKIPLPRLLISGIVPIGFAAAASVLKIDDQPQYVYISTLALLAVYLLLLLTVRLWKKRQSLALFLVGGVMLTEACGQGIFGFYANGNVTRSLYLNDQKSYGKLMAKIGDDSFYRSEIDITRMRNITMYAGGNALVMFNSVMPASTTRLCEKLGIEARQNKNGYVGVTKLMNDVFGIKYVLSPEAEGDTFYQFKKIDSDGNLTVFKNDNALSIGFLADPTIKEWDIETGNPIDVQNSFVELAAGEEPIYVLDRYIDMEHNGSYGISIPEDKQVYLYIDDKPKTLLLNTPEYVKAYSQFTDHLYPIYGIGDDRDASFVPTMENENDVKLARIYTCANSDYQKVVDKLAESQLTDVDAHGNHLSGSIHANRDGTLVITVPYDKGWRVTVDGHKAEAVCIGGSLMGIDLAEGDHEISMTFVPSGLIAGMILSAVSVIMFALSVSWERRRKEEEPAAVKAKEKTSRSKRRRKRASK